jgi:hypothetical protein
MSSAVETGEWTEETKQNSNLLIVGARAVA